MSLLHVEGVTHWSIPVNNLEESEAFYGDLLGLTPVGRLGTARMACFIVGGHHSLLCERAATMDRTFVEDPKVHHAFTVSPETLVRACKLFRERQYDRSAIEPTRCADIGGARGDRWRACRRDTTPPSAARAARHTPA